LGLDVYHILEDEVRARIPQEIWDSQVGVMADVLDVDEITAAVRGMRERGASSA
jgi:glycine/sarcosine/betaine reductase complex component A